MKIATFNINNVNKRLANLLAWLRSAKPDAVCLQELKATDREFPKAAIGNAGYGAVWRGQKSWNGVAILAPRREPIVTRTELPGDPADLQARYIEAAVNGVLITSLYAPNGNPQPGPKFKYKLAWMDRLAAHAAELFAANVPVVLAGDFNVVPTDGDIYPKNSYAKDALLAPETCARFTPSRPRLARRCPLGPSGRCDVYLLELFAEPLATRCRAAHRPSAVEQGSRQASGHTGVDRAVRGNDTASDHAPAWVELRVASPLPSPTSPQATRRRTKDGEPRGTRSKAHQGPLLVIDGDSFAHRAYHALPKNIRRKGDRPAGAILGFANLLLRLYREVKPRAVPIGWDTYEEPTYRHDAFAAYQSGREFDDEIIEQLAIIPKFVAACGFANAKKAGYEADDFLAAASAAEERRGGTSLIASGDRDTFQLASAKTTILYPIRGGGVERIGPRKSGERYGVDPAQVPDFIALRGYPPDKLPGAPGVGASGAATLLRQFGSLDAILKAGRFAKQADELRLYRSIATMNRKAPLPKLPDQKPTWQKAATLVRAWELNQLATRLDELD